jgi:hypothetical protein
MNGSIWRKAGAGVIALVLLLGGLLAGVSYGGGGGITEPTVLELVSANGCAPGDGDPGTECRDFPLEDASGALSGTISRFRVQLRDVDGNAVGRASLGCIEARKTGSICTLVLSLKPGPHTELGTIVSTGTGLPPSAITGGSGAYLNVRGDVTGESQNDGFHVFVNLIP